MKRLIRRVARGLGFDIVRYQPPSLAASFPPDISDDDRAILEQIAGYSKTSVERQVSLVQAIRYLVRRGTEGCFVECGVWRGGSSMASALTLAQEGDTSRHLYLFDTFEGMTSPTDVDVDLHGTSAQTRLDRETAKDGYWCIAGLDEVTQNMASTGYPQDHIHFIKGRVEATIPAQAPAGPIALLRLDTDWYESTRHELLHLFPLLCEGGVMIIDDYGHWKGQRKATDEYLTSLPRAFYLHRMDYTGRLLLKR
jgi:hypothetical protein